MKNETELTKENPSNTGGIRDNKGRFLKGSTPNPGGRPKGQPGFAAIFRKGLKLLAKEKGKTADKLLVEIMSQALERASNDQASFAFLIQMLYGKASESVELKQATAHVLRIVEENQSKPVK